MELILAAEKLQNPRYLTFILDNFNARDSYKDNVIAEINDTLSNVTKRDVALRLLEIVCVECPEEQLIKSMNHWMIITLKQCEQTGEKAVQAFKTLKKLIETCQAHASVKQYVPGFVPQIIAKIINVEQSGLVGSNHALDCLLLVLLKYNVACGAHKNVLSKFLHGQVDCRDARRFGKIAKAIHLLEQIGGAGADKQTHEKNWCDKVTSICDYVTYLLNHTFANVSEMFDKPVDVYDPDLFPRVTDESNVIVKLQNLNVRVKNIVAILQEMIGGFFPAAKLLNVGRVIEIITRVLSVNNAYITATHVDTFDVKMLKTILPSLHVSVWRLLQTCILSLKSNLLPYSTTIIDLIHKNLEWTRTTNTARVQTYPFLRREIYQTLIIWLKTTQGAGNILNLSLDLVKQTVNDCQTPREQLQLIRSNPEKPKKRKNKHSIDAEIIRDEPRTVGRVGNDQVDVCVSALKCLQAIFETNGCVLPGKVHKRVLVFCVTELSKQTEPSSIYRNAACRRELFRTLLALFSNVNTSNVPPTAYAMDFFTNGQLDVDFTVRDVCQEGLRVMEKIVHPTAASFANFPEGIRDDDDEEIERDEEIEARECKKRRVEEVNVVGERGMTGRCRGIEGKRNISVEDDSVMDISTVDLCDTTIQDTPIDKDAESLRLLEICDRYNITSLDNVTLEKIKNGEFDSLQARNSQEIVMNGNGKEPNVSNGKEPNVSNGVVKIDDDDDDDDDIWLAFNDVV